MEPAPADISDGGNPPPAKRCGACNKPLENDRRDDCDDRCKRDARASFEGYENTPMTTLTRPATRFREKLPSYALRK